MLSNAAEKRVVLIATLPTLLYVGMLLLFPRRDILILWERDFSASPGIAVAIAAACTTYALALWLLLRNAPPRLSTPRKQALAALFVLGSLTLQLLVTAAAEGNPLVGIVRRTFDWSTGGYWTVGAFVEDVRDFIGRYPERAPTYPVHQMRHPPGLSLIFTAGVALMRLLPSEWSALLADPLRAYSCQSLRSVDTPAPYVAAAWVGIAAEMFLALLVAAPLFAWLRRLGDERSAAWAVGLYGLTPGLSAWVSQFDRGVALATVVILYSVERLVREQRLRHAWWAGFSFSVATFATFGAIPIALIALVYAVVRLVQLYSIRTIWELRWRIIAAFLLAAFGAASIWGAMWLWSDLDPFALYQTIFESHLGIEFPYWPFVFWHPWDHVTMAGIPLVALLLAKGWHGKALPIAAAYTITLGALSLAHVARAETGRVWLYFNPIVVAGAALLLAEAPRTLARIILALFVLHGAIQGILLRPMQGLGILPSEYPTYQVPPEAQVIDTRFTSDGAIALRAYHLSSAPPGGEGHITLFWERVSERNLDLAYKVFVHVAKDEADQQRIAQHDEMPYRSKYPTTCWQKGQIIADTHFFRVDPSAEAGEYLVFVGLYEPVLGVRAPAFASPPARELHASILLPTRFLVRSPATSEQPR